MNRKTGVETIVLSNGAANPGGDRAKDAGYSVEVKQGSYPPVDSRTISVGGMITVRGGRLRFEPMACDVGDSAASALDQVSSGEPADGLIVRSHVRRARVGEPPVDQHVRDAAGFDSLKNVHGGRRLCRGQD